MNKYVWVLLLVFIVFYILEKVMLHLKKTVNEDKPLPYKMKDSLLTAAELNFYKSLSLFLNDQFIIFTKVSLKDIFYISKDVGKDYLKYFNKISSKHVDFIICQKETCKPLYAIELDDSSHKRSKRKQRDAFVNKVYKTAGLKLIHIPVQRSYTQEMFNTFLKSVITSERHQNQKIICSKCGAEMVLRTGTRGKYAGKKFYGCSNYPNCKNIILDAFTGSSMPLTGAKMQHHKE